MIRRSLSVGRSDGFKKRIIRLVRVLSSTLVARAYRRVRGYVLPESHVIVQWNAEAISEFRTTQRADACVVIHRAQWSDALEREMKKHMTSTQLEDRKGVLANGGLFWLVECESCVAGWGCATPASVLDAWWWPLSESDWVISRVETFKAFRGRGLAPWALERIAMDCGANGGRVYADIVRSNGSSRLAFRKAGAREIGVSKRLQKLCK
jgi:Acetyltransferase (GNAT) family